MFRSIDERASVRLMRALGSLGDRAGVEKEYARLQRALDVELSEAPLPEARRAYRQALEAAAGKPTGGAGEPGPEPATTEVKRPPRRAARRGSAMRDI